MPIDAYANYAGSLNAGRCIYASQRSAPAKSATEP